MRAALKALVAGADDAAEADEAGGDANGAAA